MSCNDSLAETLQLLPYNFQKKTNELQPRSYSLLPRSNNQLKM